MQAPPIPAQQIIRRLRAGDRIESCGVTIERKKDGRIVVTAPAAAPLRFIPGIESKSDCLLSQKPLDD